MRVKFQQLLGPYYLLVMATLIILAVLSISRSVAMQQALEGVSVTFWR